MSLRFVNTMVIRGISYGSLLPAEGRCGDRSIAAPCSSRKAGPYSHDTAPGWAEECCRVGVSGASDEGYGADMTFDAEPQNIGDFDYIIVGAGSAGCVLANRLTRDPACRVLLIEAGGKDNWIWFHIPAGYLRTIG